MKQFVNFIRFISIGLILSACTPNYFLSNQKILSEIIQSPLDFLPLHSSNIWVYKGKISETNLKPSVSKSGPILRINSMKQPFILGRKTNKSVLVTPFLKWNWKPKLGNWDYHPVSIFIALDSGNTILEKPMRLLKLSSKSGGNARCPSSCST